jgi:hypothetical protein
VHAAPLNLDVKRKNSSNEETFSQCSAKRHSPARDREARPNSPWNASSSLKPDVSTAKARKLVANRSRSVPGRRNIGLDLRCILTHKSTHPVINGKNRCVSVHRSTAIRLAENLLRGPAHKDVVILRPHVKGNGRTVKTIHVTPVHAA